MAFELKENTGTAFLNSYYSKGGKAPKFKGEINIDGQIRTLVLFEGTTKQGKPYLFCISQDKVEAELEAAQRKLDYWQDVSEAAK